MSYDVFNPFLYKNGLDFLKQTGLTHNEAIAVLDAELKKRKMECSVDDKFSNSGKC